MKQTMKKLFGISLCILLLLSLLPARALAMEQDAGSILQEAYALQEGASLPYATTLTGEIVEIRTPYDSLYRNITVTIQIPGYELMPVQCYRLKGDGAEALKIGDTITVTGCLTNYRGTIEFIQGCTLDAVIPGDQPSPLPPYDPRQVVDEAYELAPGEKLPYLVTLSGTVTEIVTPYDENYRNITVLLVVEGRETKPITCYRMKGDGTELLQEGDVITVQGSIQNYAKYDNDTGELLYTTVEFYPSTMLENQSNLKTRVYCYTPSDWTQCYAYCWSNDGYVVGAEWPGTLMTEENVNLWSFEVSEAADGIVFTNGRGYSDDTTDSLVIPDNDNILYMVEKGMWKPLDYYFDDPEEWGPDSLALVGDGLPGIPVWYPEAPEGDLEEVSDNVYEKTLQVPAGTTMRFKIVGNDCWDDQWNFGCSGIQIGQLHDLECGGGSLDMTLTVERDCTLRFTVDLNPMRDGGYATLLVTEVAPVCLRKLTVDVPEFWPHAYLYTFEPDIFGSWPGASMQQVGSGCYQIMIPDDATRMVISHEEDGGGYFDTGVIELENNGCDVIVTVGDDYSYEIDYIRPEENWQIRDLYLGVVDIGGVYGWSPDELGTPFEEVSDNVFVKELELPKDVSMLFKPHGMNRLGERVVFGGAVISMGETICLKTDDNSPYLDLWVRHDCTVRFTVDLNPLSQGGQATFLAEELEQPVTYRKLTVFAPSGWPAIYAYTWEPELLHVFPGVPMDKIGDRYEMQLPDNMVNLVFSWQVGEDAWSGTDPIFLNTNGTDVEVTIDEFGKCSVEYVPPSGLTYRVVGSASWMGNWDPASDVGKMQQLSKNRYQKIFRNVWPGSYEFKITKDGRWDDAIGKPNGWNFRMYVEEVSDVSVTLTLLSGVPAVKIEYIHTQMGDVNGDGTLNLGDISRLYAHIRGSKLLTDEGALYSADFTGDGDLNIGDTAGLYAYIRGTDKTAIVDAAYRLGENQQLHRDHTLEGTVVDVIEPYDPVRNCMTVSMIVDGRKNCPILCSRLTGADIQNITPGDRITVTGRLRNFYGIVEFKEGCRLEKWEHVANKLEQMQQLVDEAYALGLNETMDHPVTLTGRVICVDQPYTADVPFISVTIQVEGREENPIFCYRMVGPAIAWLEVGDHVSVVGTLRNYNSVVEFAAGCRLQAMGTPV